MKPVFDRTPRCMPPGVGSGTRRKSPSRESARASRFWAPSNCGALVSITGRTRSSTQTPTWAFWATGALLSAVRGDPDSRQRLVPQGCRGVEVVRFQSLLAGSAPTAAALTGVQSHGAPLATHAQDRNSQPVLRNRHGTGRHLVTGLRRDATAS